jgi:hypothetical protein
MFSWPRRVYQQASRTASNRIPIRPRRKMPVRSLVSNLTQASTSHLLSIFHHPSSGPARRGMQTHIIVSFAGSPKTGLTGHADLSVEQRRMGVQAVKSLEWVDGGRSRLSRCACFYGGTFRCSLTSMSGEVVRRLSQERFDV